MNALRAKDFRKAAILAFELEQPYRLLQVVQEIMALEQMEMLDEIVGAFKPEQLVTCLGYVRDWNTTARNAHQAQVMLLSILRIFPYETLCGCKGMKEIVDSMIPYTERHFSRLEDALQRTYALDFTLHAMNKVLGGDDGFGDDAQALTWSIDTLARGQRELTTMAAGPEPPSDEGYGSSDGNDDEVDEGTEGWGSWGGPSGAATLAEEEEEGDEDEKDEETADRSEEGTGAGELESADEEAEDDEDKKIDAHVSKSLSGRKTPAKTPAKTSKVLTVPAATTGKRKSKSALSVAEDQHDRLPDSKKRRSLPADGAVPKASARKRLEVAKEGPSATKSAKKSAADAARSPVATRSGKTPAKASTAKKVRK